LTKLSLRAAEGDAEAVTESSDAADETGWTLLEEHYDDQGALEFSNVVSFRSRAEAEAELSRLDLSNLEQQRLLDGETITLWQ
jgi:hypothetical protein